tara:strand:- start:320 stop:670 length:351 start_codon:yes stop_codon:yes gene_type:complete
MPYPIAKQISQDLITGDSAQEMLGVLIEELDLTNQKLVLKDSLISVYRSKEFNLLEQVRNEKMAKEAYIIMYDGLERENERVNKQYKKQKFVNRIYKVGFWGGLIAGITGYIILTK